MTTIFAQKNSQATEQGRSVMGMRTDGRKWRISNRIHLCFVGATGDLAYEIRGGGRIVEATRRIT
jgi:hypothetical protein